MDTFHNCHESKCGSETHSMWVKAGCCCKPQISNPFDRFFGTSNTAWKMKVCLLQILQGLQVLFKSCICEIEEFLQKYIAQEQKQSLKHSLSIIWVAPQKSASLKLYFVLLFKRLQVYIPVLCAVVGCLICVGCDVTHP